MLGIFLLQGMKLSLFVIIRFCLPHFFCPITDFCHIRLSKVYLLYFQAVVHNGLDLMSGESVLIKLFLEFKIRFLECTIVFIGLIWTPKCTKNNAEMYFLYFWIKKIYQLGFAVALWDPAAGTCLTPNRTLSYEIIHKN